MPSAHARGLAALRRFLATAGAPAPGAPLPLRLADALAPPAELLAEPWNVILGNPPWRGRSSNRQPWIAGLLGEYRHVDGRPLGERNPKWLQDDCVKFLRLAQWRLDQTGEGIVAFVLNRTCLDAPTFRGLRRSLLRSFEEVYALDLHGDRRKRERAPGGGPDENVFPGVAQGAAVLVLVKRSGLPRRVLRADLYGSRRAKLAALGESDVGTTRWTEVEPTAPSYLFLAGDRQLEREYRRGLALPEIFPVYTCGIITGRDALTMALDRRAVERGITRLRELPAAADPAGLPARRREALRRDAGWRRKLTGMLVRPFDLRHLCYADYLLERPRTAGMAHMLGGVNLGLVVPRQDPEEPGALVTRWLAGHKAVSAYDVNFLFPLYLRSGRERRPNLAPNLQRRLAAWYGEEPGPEAVLGYVYALLYSPGYRSRYRALLRQGFPRIVFPADRRSFAALAALGNELIDLHLLRDPRLRLTPVRLVGDAGQSLGRSLPELEPGGRIRLNRQGLCAEGVEPRVWEYRIGGYRVLPQWLRARAGRAVSYAELRELRWTAEALRRTIEVQERIAQGADRL